MQAENALLYEAFCWGATEICARCSACVCASRSGLPAGGTTGHDSRSRSSCRSGTRIAGNGPDDGAARGTAGRPTCARSLRGGVRLVRGGLLIGRVRLDVHGVDACLRLGPPEAVRFIIRLLTARSDSSQEKHRVRGLTTTRPDDAAAGAAGCAGAACAGAAVGADAAGCRAYEPELARAPVRPALDSEATARAA